MNTDEQRWASLDLEASRVFTPTSPIDEKSLFAGRRDQVRAIVDVINQKGQHAMLYGERGVGKTSLANVLSSFLQQTAPAAPRVNCDSTDTFSTVWRKVFDRIELAQQTRGIGFAPLTFGGRGPANVSEMLGSDEVTPDSVRRALTLLSEGVLAILIIDEFDRLPITPRRAFADTIKTLSDHAVGATVLLVGVADSVEQLIEEHRSVERALVQVRMPRMSAAEIMTIITTGATRLSMTVTDSATNRIAKLAQGLPHYAHLLGLHATRASLAKQSRIIDVSEVNVAIKRAIDGTQQSIRSAYDFAVRSPRTDNLFKQVLLACAMAKTNELGFFAAQDVRDPMKLITGKKYEIPSFAQHLNEFCDTKRGPILQKDGERRRFRYRFLDPLLQPFVIMRGLDAGQIGPEALD